MFESFQLFQGQRSPSLYFPSGSGASAKGPVYAGPPYSMAQRPATCPLLPPHVATPGLLTQQASRPKCISAVHHKRTQAQLHSKSAGSLLLLLPILSATPARGWVVSCPHLVFVLLLPIPLPQPSAQPWRQRLCSFPASRRPRQRSAAPTARCSRRSSSAAPSPVALGPSGLRGGGRGSRCRPCKRRRRGRRRRPRRSPRSTGSSSASGK